MRHMRSKPLRNCHLQTTSYEREDVIRSLAHHLGFVRVTDTIREPIKSAINSAIRQGLLGYEGSVIWRAE
jgi:predicted small metal-binding protein